MYAELRGMRANDLQRLKNRWSLSIRKAAFRTRKEWHIERSCTPFLPLNLIRSLLSPCMVSSYSNTHQSLRTVLESLPLLRLSLDPSNRKAATTVMEMDAAEDPHLLLMIRPEIILLVQDPAVREALGVFFSLGSFAVRADFNFYRRGQNIRRSFS